MNILFTSVGNFLSLESDACLTEWRARHHIVERMPMERLVSYLRVDPASTLALVDAIVCMADSDQIAYEGFRSYPSLDFPLEKALALAEEVRNLPETCTMRDGRKWKKIPFAIFGSVDSSTMWVKQRRSHPSVYPIHLPLAALDNVKELVDEYQDRVLDDYSNLGILVRFEKGRAQISQALKLKDKQAESDYYYAPGTAETIRGGSP